ncbi:MAG: hypothetical protein ACKPKO_10380, partial [Candidatus Fonsibacter sp.]
MHRDYGRFPLQDYAFFSPAPGRILKYDTLLGMGMPILCKIVHEKETLSDLNGCPFVSEHVAWARWLGAGD